MVAPTASQRLFSAASERLVSPAPGIKYYTHGSLASGFLTGKYKKGVDVK